MRSPSTTVIRTHILKTMAKSAYPHAGEKRTKAHGPIKKRTAPAIMHRITAFTAGHPHGRKNSLPECWVDIPATR